MKIQTRITLLFTLLCICVIVTLSFGVYYFTYQNASQDFYTRLQLRANIAARAYLENGSDTATFASIRRAHLRRLPSEREYIINADTLQKFNLSRLSDKMPADFFQQISRNKEASFRDDFDFFHGIVYKNGNDTYFVIIAAENAFLKEFLFNLRKILIIACVVGVLVVFSIGLLFSREILAPIRNISRQVQNITATSLHQRLKVKQGKDEIAMLANTFNDMLTRLETAFETQNNFVSNASHELNTPLTAIIGEADYALSKQRPEDQYRQSLSIISQQGEKLRRITQSLVQLARSGFRENFSQELVDMNELLFNAKQNAHNVYSQCNVEINNSLYPENGKRLLISGNAQLLELALSNIILNACKYSNQQPVSVALGLSAQHVVILIKDNGIGIPETDLKNIFDPFFRASNVHDIGGYGIGLPLAQNIIKMHKGTIQVASSVNLGTEVIVRLPVKRQN